MILQIAHVRPTGRTHFHLCCLCIGFPFFLPFQLYTNYFSNFLLYTVGQKKNQKPSILLKRTEHIYKSYKMPWPKEKKNTKLTNAPLRQQKRSLSKKCILSQKGNIMYGEAPPSCKAWPFLHENVCISCEPNIPPSNKGYLSKRRACQNHVWPRLQCPPVPAPWANCFVDNSVYLH